MGGFGKSQALLHDTDHHAADDVDHHHEQAGYGVAPNEFRGAVHGAEEAGFVFQGFAPPPRVLLVDEAGGKVGINRHLLARHGIEVEARGHFRDAPRTLGDDHEIHDHQDGEDDNADDEVAAHNEAAECLDDVAGGGRSLVTMRQDQARRS